MATTQIAILRQKTLEDPLVYLPCSRIEEYKKDQTIYRRDQASTHIYLVLDGRVKIARVSEDGQRSVVEIYHTDEFFGESGLLGLPRLDEAIALDRVRVMSWTPAQIEDVMAQRPKLAIAMVQILAQRTLECEKRIEEFSTANTSRRLVLALLRFSHRLGEAEPDGAYRMAPFTHELLAQYLGTSREIVTHFMNEFRRRGFLHYSRKGIILYREPFRDWLRQDSHQEVRRTTKAERA